MRYRTLSSKKFINLTFIFLVISASAAAFDYSNPVIPVEEIISGGPEKDAIPALTDPQTTGAAQADYLLPHDRILGVLVKGHARAYPVKILNWHEAVNDEIEGKPLLITYCPLCGSGMVFDSYINSKRMYFGVSGLLYKSDALFYDLATDGLWSQLAMKAVTGPYSGTELSHYPAEMTTWRSWTERYPETEVLSIETGYEREYLSDPYFIYSVTSEAHLPGLDRDKRLGFKDWVYGVVLNGDSRAYPLSELVKSRLPVNDRVGGVDLQIDYTRLEKTVRISDPQGNPVPGVQCYWFAWSAFHPETSVYFRDESRNVRSG